MIKELIELLEELIDIEGPQPGTAEWAEKVRVAIAKAKEEPMSDLREELKQANERIEFLQAMNAEFYSAAMDVQGKKGREGA